MNPTPSPERPEHNPDGLPEMEEFRFLHIDEELQSGDEAWMPRTKRWVFTLNRGLKVHCGSPTYRRRVATRTPAPEAVAGDQFQKGGDELCPRIVQCAEASTFQEPPARTAELNAPADVQSVSQGQATPPADKDAEKAACNCSGGDDGAWGLVSHTSNCAVTLQAKLEAAESERDVLNGTWCAQNVAEGRGKCGACKTCLRSTNQSLLALVDTLAGALRYVQPILKVLARTSEIPKCGETIGNWEHIVEARKEVDKALAHAAEGKEKTK